MEKSTNQEIVRERVQKEVTIGEEAHVSNKEEDIVASKEELVRDDNVEEHVPNKEGDTVAEITEATVAVIEESETKVAIIENTKEDSLTPPIGEMTAFSEKPMSYLPLFFFLTSLIYLELALHLIIYRSMDAKIIYPIIFTLPLAFLFTFLTGIFSWKANKIVMLITTGLICFIYGLQLVYYDVFKVFFSVQSLGMADDAIAGFGDQVGVAIWSNLPSLLIMFLPMALLPWILHRFYSMERRTLKQQGVLLLLVPGMHILALTSLLIYGKGDHTPFDLYHKTKIPELSGKQLGIATLVRFDVFKNIKGNDEFILADTGAIPWEGATVTPPMPTAIPQITEALKPEGNNQGVPDVAPSPSPTPTPIPIDTSPNIIEIDFAALIKQEKKETVQTLHKYFDSVTPTNKNEYTGMFEGYNLILITAEGFSPYAVHEEVTPTLYRLTKEGFVFNNFYTALWQTSTSDGEYVALTGMIPVGTRSMYHSRSNLMPFALGNQFRLLGVDSKAYHNHSYTYYQRNETHPNLGYNFTGVGNGLILDSDVWPESDLEMINHTVDLYMEEEPFHVYYLTVSGHMNYTFTGNSMSYRNRALVEHLPYSSDSKAYLACQIELDRALETLIKELEEAGVADRTVIALSADHYPYGWDKQYIDELAGHEVDPRFEIYRNHFFIWNSAMEESIIVEEPCSSLDILPTLSNLFGITYDSRLLMGQDIFSDAPPLVILNNRSFVTDKVMYHSESGEITLMTEEELPENYISNMNKIIKNKFSVSQQIVKQDYYSYLFPNYPEEFMK